MTSRTTPPLVSIAMVVFHPHPVYFREAVQSILAQTFPDFELIVLEDPSPVCGRDLLAGLDDRRIRYILNPRRTSLVAQRNRVLAEARADLVAVHDADDISEPTRLEKQVSYLRAHPEVGIVGSQVCVIDSIGAVCGYRAFPLDHHSIRQAMKRFLPVSQPSTMFWKALVMEAGGYRESGASIVGAEDYDLVCRLALRGVHFANLPEALLQYRLHPNQLKATHLRDIIRGTIRVKRCYWEGQLDLSSRIWLWGEYLLLCLPIALIRPMLIHLLYHHPKLEKAIAPSLAAAPAVHRLGLSAENPTETAL